MTWSERFCLATLLIVLGLCLAPAAGADEGIARRLAALKGLVDPGAAEAAAAPRPETPDGAACTRGAWWKVTDYGVHSRTDAAIRDASLRFATDAKLIRSVIQHESAWDIEAVSPKGALGIMQLMPGTARELGVVCAFDPRQNILGGTRYLRRMYDRLGSWPRAVAAYHAGPARVESGRIPAETRRYARDVLRGWKPQRYAAVRLE